MNKNRVIQNMYCRFLHII